MDLTTTYLSLELANPLVPSASPLGENLDDIKRLEEQVPIAIDGYSEWVRHEPGHEVRDALSREDRLRDGGREADRCGAFEDTDGPWLHRPRIPQQSRGGQPTIAAYP